LTLTGKGFIFCASKTREDLMAAYRRVRSLTPEEAAYIAGVIDGEGTISLSRRHVTDNRQLVIRISNTERDSLDYILQMVGAGLPGSEPPNRTIPRASPTRSITVRRFPCLNRSPPTYALTRRNGRNSYYETASG